MRRIYRIHNPQSLPLHQLLNPLLAPMPGCIPDAEHVLVRPRAGHDEDGNGGAAKHNVPVFTLLWQRHVKGEGRREHASPTTNRYFLGGGGRLLVFTSSSQPYNTTLPTTYMEGGRADKRQECQSIERMP